MVERFVARPSPGRLMLLLLAALALVALGLWIAGAFGPPPDPGQAWIGYVVAPLFGLAALVGIRRLFDRDDQIIIDDQGIYCKAWSDRTIPWLAIRAIERHSYKNQDFISLTLDDPSRYSLGGLARMQGLNRMLGFGDVSLTTAGTDRTLDELLDALERFSPKGPRGPQLLLRG